MHVFVHMNSQKYKQNKCIKNQIDIGTVSEEIRDLVFYVTLNNGGREISR